MAPKKQKPNTLSLCTMLQKNPLFIALIACRPRFECERIHTDRTYERPYRPLVYRTLTHTFSPFQSMEFSCWFDPCERNSYRPTWYFFFPLEGHPTLLKCYHVKHKNSKATYFCSSEKTLWLYIQLSLTWFHTHNFLPLHSQFNNRVPSYYVNKISQKNP